MKIDIPVPCPACGGKMYSVSYDQPYPHRKEEMAYLHRFCSFERNS